MDVKGLDSLKRKAALLKELDQKRMRYYKELDDVHLLEEAIKYEMKLEFDANKPWFVRFRDIVKDPEPKVEYGLPRSMLLELFSTDDKALVLETLDQTLQIVGQATLEFSRSRSHLLHIVKCVMQLKKGLTADTNHLEERYLDVATAIVFYLGRNEWDNLSPAEAEILQDVMGEIAGIPGMVKNVLEYFLQKRIMKR